MKKKEIEHQKTTTYYLQINGLIKRVNQKIKQYLRKFVSHNQDDQTELLTLIEYVYNIRTKKK